MWSPGSIAKKYTFLRDATQGVPYGVHLLLPYTWQGKQKKERLLPFPKIILIMCYTAGAVLLHTEELIEEAENFPDDAVYTAFMAVAGAVFNL